jgi:hypothetical protein
MGGVQTWTVPVMLVRPDGSVGLRMGEATTTPGLFVVADSPACSERAGAARHMHRRWRVPTIFGYLVGDLSLTSRRDAHAAAAAPGDLEVDWTDAHAHLAGDHEAEARLSAEAVLSRWGSPVRCPDAECACHYETTTRCWGKIGEPRPGRCDDGGVIGGDAWPEPAAR